MPRSTIRLVAIGGGTGLATLLRGLKHFVHSEGPWSISDLAAIVTVTDEGGSSGVLRREFSMLPPGDIRNCIVALAEEEKILSQLFSYRFGSESTLTGHSLGNLLLTALTDLRGSFLEAVREVSEVLAIRGTIYPAALEDVRVRALCADGTVLVGETAIGGDWLAEEVPPEHARIVRLELEPASPAPLPEALDAIGKADVIVIGPGSLYTSVIPNLVIPELGEAVRNARGLKIYICNVMTQPGETDGYDAEDHLRALFDHAGLVAEAMIVNGLRPTTRFLEAYKRRRQFPVECDPDAIRALGVTPFFGDIIAEGNYLRHDPGALADTVFRLYERYGRRLQKLRRER
ncbi:MAG: YvcK family protein [Acidobacteria bacterium]|nr:YvcK family protein [Acidobacteriota bacterium]